VQEEIMLWFKGQAADIQWLGDTEADSET
jgi:hypothetical protein